MYVLNTEVCWNGYLLSVCHVWVTAAVTGLEVAAYHHLRHACTHVYSDEFKPCNMTKDKRKE